MKNIFEEINEFSSEKSRYSALGNFATSFLIKTRSLSRNCFPSSKPLCVPGRLGKVRPAVADLVAGLDGAVRVGVIGGAGGSLAFEGGPRLVDTAEFTEEYKPEALEAVGILDDLQAGDAARDWFYVHPAGGFGAWAPGERTGSYRDGGDVLVVDADGESFISGPDLAVT